VNIASPANSFLNRARLRYSVHIRGRTKTAQRRESQMGHQSPISPGLTRRGFLITTAATAGGMALGIADARAMNLASAPWTMDPSQGATEISAWIVIAADDSVTVRVPMPEIGNGILTQVAMTVAEELACDWSKVRAEFASPLR